MRSHLREQQLAPLQFALIVPAVWLEVFQFVTGMTKRNAVVEINTQFRVLGKGFDMMSPQISALGITTFAASVVIALKDRV